MKPKTSLQHRGERFADAAEQLVALAPQNDSQEFQASLTKAGIAQLKADEIEILPYLYFPFGRPIHRAGSEL